MKSFLDMYSTLHSGNLHKLKDVYSDDIRFIDPAHEISGLDELTRYFENLYKNVLSISFDFMEPMIVGKSGFVRWQMGFAHRRLAHGSPVMVDGVSYIEFNDKGKVCYHRDYFDLGAMIYEHVTLLGRFIQIIKKGLGK